MVAYSFQRQFVEPIRAGTKQQTIRAHRKRHARPGEQLQLYTGMRTKYAKLIGRATCKSIHQIKLTFGARPNVMWFNVAPDERSTLVDFETFARRDGFRDWTSLAEFWAEFHPGLDVFDGVLIFWGDSLDPASIAAPILR